MGLASDQGARERLAAQIRAASDALFEDQMVVGELACLFEERVAALRDGTR